MMVKQDLAETFSGPDFSDIYDMSENKDRIKENLDDIIFHHGLSVYLLTDFVEQAFVLYRHNKPVKMKILIEFINDISKKYDSHAGTYFASMSKYDTGVYDFDDKNLSELVINMSFLGLMPSDELKPLLNKDVLAFLEL